MPRSQAKLAPPRLQLAIVGTDGHADLPARSTLRRWVGMATERNAELSLVFVDTRAGRRLNREFRGRDYATNVLTFSYETRPRVLADIVLCLPVLRREAQAGGRTLREHLAHLVLHGVLHAQGYDHETRQQARAMQARERALLARLRISDPYATLEK